MLVLVGGIRLLFGGGRTLAWSVGVLGLALLAFAGWLTRGLFEVHQQMMTNPMLVARLGPGLFVSTAGAALATATLLVFYITRRAEA